jgi:AbrB family looped-hinge helix DNA binding protein
MQRMQISDKGQVTIPKHIRIAAGIAPGSEVSFSLEGSKVVITSVGTGIKDDRRPKLRAAAAAADDLLDVYETQRTPLPWSCASLTAAAFAMYRSRGGAKPRPLPDFFIGAHAAVANLSVLTRDPSPYRTHFPRRVLVAP